MEFFNLFGKKKEQKKELRIELKSCDYCKEMIYENDKINAFGEKIVHKECYKVLKEEVKEYYG